MLGLIALLSIEGSGEPARMHNRAFVACMHTFLHLDVVDFSDQCLHSLQQRAFKVYLCICNKYQSHLYHMYDVKNKCILLNAL